MPELLDAALVKILHKDKQILEQTKLPIVTVSATFREDLKKFYGFPDNDSTPDVVFSRAHYSMTLGIALTAWQDSKKSAGSGPKKRLSQISVNQQVAWAVDPTNYVSHQDWLPISISQTVGETLARHSLLKLFKDVIDKFGRQKLPIIDSITPPLLYLTQRIQQPILSMHIAAGNVLAAQGKTVLQVITDPHVRYDYLVHAEKPNFFYCVFDENTKLELLEKAQIADMQVDPNRIFVTGPPIDPRVVAVRTKKRAWRSGPLKLCITTGGLGTNKDEIGQLLQNLLPELRKKDTQLQLLVYAATHDDISDLVRDMAKQNRVAIGELDDVHAKLRILYHPQIVDANELLVRYGFPWAHGFVTKPSGDMAYDAAAAGCFILTLAEWGEWEHRIREIFEQKGISRKANVEEIVPQLNVLRAARGGQSWVEQAMLAALSLEPLFLRGSESIIETYKRVSEDSND